MRICVAVLVFCFLTLGIGSPVWAQDCDQDITVFLDSLDTTGLTHEQVEELEHLIGAARGECYEERDEAAAQELLEEAKALVSGN